MNGAKTLYLRGMNDYPLTEKTTSLNRFYVYGPTGLITVIDNGTNYFILKDHLGSTHVVLDEDDSLISWYDYTPYGKIWASQISEDSRYRFTGQEYDPETNLLNFRARMYDPTLGIFYAGDPAGQGFSPYSYCGGNPTVYVDKDGRFFLIPILIGALVGGSISGLTYSAFSGSHWTWSGFGNAVLGGAIAGGLSSIGGAFIQNATLGMLNQTLSYTVSNAIMGQHVTSSGIIGSLVGGIISGSIPAFQAIKDASSFENGVAEILYGSIQMGIGGAFGGGVSNLLEKKSFFEGFENGFTRGAVSGAVLTGLKIGLFGTAIQPNPEINGKAIEGLEKMENDMSENKMGMGIYKSTNRGGGLWQLFSDKGQNLAIDSHIGMKSGFKGYLSDLFVHETGHYYQAIRDGWAYSIYNAIFNHSAMENEVNSWVSIYYRNLFR